MNQKVNSRRKYMHMKIGCLLTTLALSACSTSFNKAADTKDSQSAIGEQELERSCASRYDYNLGADFARFDVMAQQLAHASGCFISTDLAKTGDINVNPVIGRMSIRDAVKTAIAGTRLQIVYETPYSLTVDEE